MTSTEKNLQRKVGGFSHWTTTAKQRREFCEILQVNKKLIPKSKVLNLGV